jgi:16S rRNA processing protein RimM
MADKEQRIVVGEIIGSHGVRGVAKVRIFAEDETLLNQDQGLYISADQQNNDCLLIQLKSAYKNDVWLADIDGITAPEQIQEMGKTLLYIDSSALPVAEDDEDGFYYHQLEGLHVYQDADGQKGKEVGIVTAVQNFGGGDLLDIRAKNGSQFYHPFTNGDVPVLDIKAGYITIIQAEII